MNENGIETLQSTPPSDWTIAIAGNVEAAVFHLLIQPNPTDALARFAEVLARNAELREWFAHAVRIAAAWALDGQE